MYKMFKEHRFYFPFLLSLFNSMINVICDSQMIWRKEYRSRVLQDRQLAEKISLKVVDSMAS